jgi:hypothetical protein
MEEWVSSVVNPEITVCIILKKRRNKFGKWEYLELERFIGTWNDLVSELNRSYGQWEDEIEYLPTRAAKENKLDEIANIRAAKDTSYEFKLADFTDDWYVGYCKSLTFRLDHLGNLT